MTKVDIMKKLNRVFREVFDDASLKITEKTSAKDIDEWDSLMHITLIAEVEDAFAFAQVPGDYFKVLVQM